MARATGFTTTGGAPTPPVPARGARWAVAGLGAAALVLVGVASEWVLVAVIVVCVAIGVLVGRIWAVIGARHRFDAVAHLTNEAVVVTGAGRRVMYVSPSVRQLLGHTPEEFAALGFDKLVHPAERDTMRIAAGAVRADPEGSMRLTVRLMHRDGDWRHVEMSSVNRLDDPSVQGVVTTLHDVSERMSAERAVRSSGERFKALVANSTDVLILLDVHGRTIFASPTIAPNLGVHPDDIVGIDIAELSHPDDRPLADALFDRVRSEPGAREEMELRARRDDGTYLWMEVRLQNLLDDPAVGGIVLHARDVSGRRSAEEALRASERLFRTLAVGAPIGVFLLGPDATITYGNDRFFEISGLDPETRSLVDALAVVHPVDQERLRPGWSAALRGGTGHRAAFRVVHPDGSVHQVIGQTSPITGDDGEVTGSVGTVMDVTDLVGARQDASRFQSIIENTSDFVVIADGRGVPQYVNAATRRAMGVAEGADLADLVSSEFFTPSSWELLSTVGIAEAVEHGVWSGELEMRNPADGSVLPVSYVLLAQLAPDGSVEYLASMSRDMSDQKQLEAQLQHQADHDELTGLPNRTPIVHALEVMSANAHRRPGRVGVLFVDVDRFKVINDSLGHGAGDRLLINLAQRLRSGLPAGHRAGRFGGDEFVVLCPGVADGAELLAVAERLRTHLRGSIPVEDDDVFVTVSIGAALGVSDERPAELLRDADAAMYEAKARGRDRVHLFDGAMRLEVVERLEIERELRRALERNELELYFQPVVALPSGAVEGVEVLLRWEHPERGLLQPDQFLPVAEETGLIIDIGTMVLARACVEARSWPHRRDDRPIPVYVNLSARELVDPDLISRVTHTLEATGIDPDAVHLEITENALLADATATKAVLFELRRLGVRLALDDFGTGYSSLSYLKHFPVDALKVDKTFVEGLGRDAGDAAITASIVDVAHRLGLATVAEGVERQDQAEWLAALGCDLAQGFHFARPMRARKLRGLLESIASRPGTDVVPVDEREVIDIRDVTTRDGC